MLTFGHIAVSYLIAEEARSYGVLLTDNQVLGLVVIGNLPDVDFLTGFMTGKKGEAHHQNITHTPLGIIAIWIAISLFTPTKR